MNLSWQLNKSQCRSLSFQYFCMNPKARPRDTISSEYAFARFLLTRSATTPACRLSIVLTILGTGKYRYRWNVAPLNNISSQDFSFRIFFPKPARALLSNAPRIIKIGSLSQFRHPLEFVDPIFRLQNSADLGTQDFPGFSESGSEIMDFLSQTSHFQTFLTLRVFNRFLIGWKF